ncbi:flippase-like domain-containing protein [Halomarina pelagica]|uniref:flippase-like domain-containing protein n=1 Tax=Halomarina pelagica TaxID=2961599 RepID=UPI0020C500B7|nr:flippase-like domain-containing protein [Halomarina sp. BND7]
MQQVDERSVAGRSIGRTVAPFALALVALAGLVVAMGPETVAAELARLDPTTFLAALGIALFAVVAWGDAQRRLFVSAGGRAPLGRFSAAYSLAVFERLALPAGHAAGPALMAHALDDEAETGFDRALAATSAAELLSLLASLLLAGVGLVAYLLASLLLAGVGLVAYLLAAPASAALRDVELGTLVASVVLAALLAAVWYRRGTVTWALAGTASLLRGSVGRVSPRTYDALDPERVESAVERYYDTLGAVAGDRRAVALAVLVSAVGWVCYSLPLTVGASALGHAVPLSLALFLVPASGLANAVPLPGGLGGVEVALAGALVALAGLAAPEAAAVVLAYRLCTYWGHLALTGLVALVGVTRWGIRP